MPLAIVRERADHTTPSNQGFCRLHLGGRCSLHLCRLKASSIAFDGTLGDSSNCRAKGCAQAQSEHLHRADAVVGNRIVRVVSVMVAAHFDCESRSLGGKLQVVAHGKIPCSIRRGLSPAPMSLPSDAVPISSAETVLAIDGAVSSWLKRYGGLLAACGAHHRRTLRLPTEISAASCLFVLFGLTACFAPFRSGVATFLKERLIFRRKGEFLSTIATYNLKVLSHGAFRCPVWKGRQCRVASWQVGWVDG